MSVPVGLSSPFSGGYQLGQSSRLTPAAMKLYENLIPQVGGSLSQGIGRLGRLAAGDQGEFGALEAPAFRNLQQAGSQLASQFSGAGMGARQSSGFQNALANQAGSLAERLQAQRMALQEGAMSELMSLGKDLLGTDAYDTFLVPPEQKMKKEKEPKKKWWQKAIGIGAPIAGGVAGGFLGAPMGAIAGASAGSEFGSQFLQ